MKTMIWTLMSMTMTLAAYGADRVVHFKTDFAFKVGNQVMPAGDYRVAEQSRGMVVPVFHIANLGGKESAFLILSKQTKGSSSGAAKIEFLCADATCSLLAVENLTAGQRYYSDPKTSTPAAKVVTVAARR